MSDVFDYLGSYRISWRKGFFLSFVLGFVVRLIPEILSFPHPIGFDTIYHAWRIESGVVWYHWSQLFSNWLLYAILIPIHRIAQIDPFFLLKAMVPLLYGLNVCGIYYFAKRALSWETKNALLAGAFFAFALAALRISWDLYRNMLGLAILLFTLPLIREIETGKGVAWFIPLSVFVVFSHQYASMVMFAAALGVVIKNFRKGEKTSSFRVVATVLPALILFLTSVCLMMFPVPFQVEPNVINGGDSIRPSPGGLFFLVNYLGVSDLVYYYPTYLDLASHVFSLFGLLYLLFLPLVFFGFFRDDLLNSWTCLLLAGSFSALVIPFCALDLWNRWMLMLVYPFTFYAVNGVGKVLARDSAVNPRWKWMKWMRLSKRTASAIFLCTVILGSIFIMVRFSSFQPFYITTTISYFPSTMLQTTVPLEDVKSTVEVLEMLNERMNDSSCVLVHHAFLSWARMYLDGEHVIVHYERDPEAALDMTLKYGFDPVYLVWWNENIGWYGLTVPKDFVSVFSSGRMSVFEYHS